MKYDYLYKTYLFRRPAIYYILEKNLQLPRIDVRIQKIHLFQTPSPLISTFNFIRASKFEHIPEICTHCEITVAASHARLGNHYHPHPRCCQVVACSDENPHTPNDNDVTGCWKTVIVYVCSWWWKEFGIWIRNDGRRLLLNSEHDGCRQRSQASHVSVTQ